jgi:uncharacterized protein
MNFEWDIFKAAANIRKHGVSFEEAKTVFNNPLAAIFNDELHSLNEVRETIVGHSRSNRLLIISFSERLQSIRIFSARLVTRQECEDYEQNSL